jgi:Flp pilus assembly pilin Flp
MIEAIREFIASRDEVGATAVEYAVMVFFIAVVVIGGATALGVSVNGVLNNVAAAI